MQNFWVKSTAFNEGGWIPTKHTGRGEDISPCFELGNLHENAQSIAITLDDASHPIFPNYNHWLIWNIPAQEMIPENIPYGKTVACFECAVQGKAYGRNRYRGPKPPLKSIHHYVFTFYILDTYLDLPCDSNRKKLLSVIEDHILQKASLSGKFQSHRKE